MKTLLDKIWEAHVVVAAGERPELIYCDRHLVHEVTSPQAFEGLRQAGRKVRRPELTFAVMDHVVPTEPFTRPLADEIAENELAALERNCAEFGIRLFHHDHPRQGVIHVTMPELGVILPGQTVFCGDSHTATHGAFGALAFGVGTSEVEHILATQTLPQKKLPCLAVYLEGEIPAGVTAKDLVLMVIGRLGTAGGTGYFMEFKGSAVRSLGMEGRMTLSNMAVECGAKAGLIAPDEVTFAYLEGRPFAPKGEDWRRALEYWRTLPSDPGASYDREEHFDVSGLAPQVSWGTNPGQVCGIDQAVPDPESFADPEQQKAARDALEYMGLAPGQALEGLPVQVVFIGSCTNGRLEDLRLAARVLEGRKVAPGVRVLVVPGSKAVKAQAEAEGLDRVFKEAGCEWRLPGCSMCLGMNPDLVEAGQRCASTSNRNFRDRQGRGARTHLVSPATAAAAAIKGCLSDPRPFLED